MAVNPWKLLLFPTFMFVVLSLISIFYVTPKFPHSYKFIADIIDACWFVIMILYFICVDLLMINGKAAWLLKKK